MSSAFYRGLLIATIAILTSVFLTKNIDFSVYSYGVTGFFSGSGCPYGPESGLGFPMHYRYPPVTYLLLWPLSRISVAWGGVLWMTGAWAVVSGAVLLAIRREQLRFTRQAVIAVCGLMLAYAVLTVRSGNIQPYVIAMIWMALCLADSRQLPAAALLAVAITFKIWPVFFLPWFLRRERRMVLVWLIPALALLWLSPLLLWSSADYSRLMREWYSFECATATANSEQWYFPGQSLRGVLLRYFTTLEPWIREFPDVHVLSLDPAIVVRLWGGIAGILYLAICGAVLRSNLDKRHIWDGISFALFSILQPFALKSSLISLGPAALIAAALYSREPRRSLAGNLFVCASALSFAGAILQYKPALRFLLACGIDFYVGATLLGALLHWTRIPASGGAQQSGVLPASQAERGRFAELLGESGSPDGADSRLCA